jgi:HlyD family secretion protein
MDREIPQTERRKAALKRALKIIIPFVVIIAGICIVAPLSRTSVSRASLRIQAVDRGTIETSIAAIGHVAPAFEQIINSPITSRIVEVYCKEGDSLSAGTPLLRLDLESAETEIQRMADERQSKVYEAEQSRLNSRTYLSDLEMKVKVKEMAVNRLKAEVINERRLDSIGSGTGEKVREAEFAYETGRLELQQLRQQLTNERDVHAAQQKMKRLELDIFDKNFGEKRRTLEDAQLKSPRSATLTYIIDQIGKQVNAGERVAVIADLSHYKINAEIADNNADRITVGSHVVVKLGKEELTGIITHVNPLSSNGVISFSASLDDDANPRLRSGLRAEVHVLCDIHDDVMRIPVGPFFSGRGDYTLFVLKNSRLERRTVRIGESNYRYAEVLSGLEVGDSVVISDLSSKKSNRIIRLKP